MAQSFSEFIEYSLLLLQHHRTLFPPDNARAMEKLEFLLRLVKSVFLIYSVLILHVIGRCIADLSEMRVFDRCCSQPKDLKAEVANALRKGCTDL